MRKAERLLDEHLYQQRREREEAERSGLVRADAPFTVAHLAAEFLAFQETKDTGRGTFDFYQKTSSGSWTGTEGWKPASSTSPATPTTCPGSASWGLAGATINHHLRSAKGTLNHAVDADRLLKNPWKKGKLLIERQRKRIMTNEEFEKLLKACDKCIAYRGKVSREENCQMMRDIQRRQRMMLILYRSRMRFNHLRWFAAPAADGPPRPPAALAQLKKPFPARMVVVTGNPLGETAHEAGTYVARPGHCPGSISHPAGLEASPSGLALRLCSTPLDAATAGLGPAQPDLVHRPVAGRTLRRRLRRLSTKELHQVWPPASSSMSFRAMSARPSLPRIVSCSGQAARISKR
jgi:hypothetical protein